MQNFAALALLASSLSPLAQANTNVEIDLDETYTYNGTSKGDKKIKIESNMRMTGGFVPEVLGGESWIAGKTNIWVDGTAYAVSYTQNYTWEHEQRECDDGRSDDCWVLVKKQDVKGKLHADNYFYEQSFEEKAGEGDNIDGVWWYAGERKAGFQSVTNFSHEYEEGFMAL